MQNLKHAIAENIGKWEKGDLAGVARGGIHCYIRGDKVYAEELSGTNAISMSYKEALKIAQLSIFKTN